MVLCSRMWKNAVVQIDVHLIPCGTDTPSVVRIFTPQLSVLSTRRTVGLERSSAVLTSIMTGHNAPGWGISL